VTAYQQERAALGQRLRELRRDSRLTGRQLAASCCWQPSKVSKIEAGKQTPSDADVEAWAEACGVANQTDQLISVLRSLESHYQEHRRQFHAGLATHQQEFGDQETTSSYIRNFESVFVSGLLQTPDYARARIEVAVDYDGAPADDVEQAVAARMSRQQVLYRPDAKIQLVMTEAVLRYRLCSVEAMEGQLDRLMSAATLSHLRFGIIPFDTMYAAAPTHGFWIFDNGLVRAETVAAELHVTDETEIRSYLRLFTELAELAVYGAAARALIARSLSELAGSSR
jgi:transcriptional regulator with XRE-family HTH domain